MVFHLESDCRDIINKVGERQCLFLKERAAIICRPIIMRLVLSLITSNIEYCLLSTVDYLSDCVILLDKKVKAKLLPTLSIHVFIRLSRNSEDWKIPM